MKKKHKKDDDLKIEVFENWNEIELKLNEYFENFDFSKITNGFELNLETVTENFDFTINP